MLANSLDEILENFDFIDSIVTQVKWDINLLDLIITVDYYWDIQKGLDKTRLLDLIFKNCSKADFQVSELDSLLKGELNIESCFTIVLVKERQENEYSLYDKRYVEIFTTDYSRPWLSAICSEVELQEYKS